MNEFKYFGYGVIATKKDKNTLDLKHAQSYIELKKFMLDEIIIEPLSSYGQPRYELDNLLKKISCLPEEEKGKTCVVVPNLETLGGRFQEVCQEFHKIISITNILVLDRPDFSSVNMKGEILYEIKSPKSGEVFLKMPFIKLKYKGRKGLLLDWKYKEVFWAWQNFYISTAQAVDLLETSRVTFYALNHEYMTAKYYATEYAQDFMTYMSDGLKPVRGFKLDEKTEKFLIRIQRELNDNWTLDGIDKILDRKNSVNNSDIINQDEGYEKTICKYDLFRLKLNMTEGRSALAKAKKEYLKDDTYIEQLKKEIGNMGY